MNSPDIGRLLAELDDRRIRLDTNGDGLLIAPRSAVDDNLRGRLRDVKPMLLAAMRKAASELDALVCEMRVDREWLRAEGLLAADDLDGADYEAMVSRRRAEIGLLPTLALVRAHYVDHVAGHMPHLE